jgi:hypothetical protein
MEPGPLDRRHSFMRTRILTVLLLTGVLAGCGNQGLTPSDPGDAGSAPKPAVVTPTVMPTQIPVPSGPVSTRSAGFVLGKVGEPAELCLGGVAESLPPQCGGPILDGFDFDDYPGDFEEASNVRWGEFKVTGTFDGKRIEVTKAVPARELEKPAGSDPDFSTPCPTPSGGWRVLDPEKTTDASLEAMYDRVHRLPGYADSWVDQSRNHRTGSDAEHPDGFMNDPTLLTYNVRVTGDPAEAEKEIREFWGGALCVTRVKHTEKELTGIQAEVSKLPGMLSNTVQHQAAQIYVIYDDGTLQAWADMKYGVGLVEISSALSPA